MGSLYRKVNINLLKPKKTQYLWGKSKLSFLHCIPVKYTGQDSEKTPMLKTAVPYNLSIY